MKMKKNIRRILSRAALYCLLPALPAVAMAQSSGYQYLDEAGIRARFSADGHLFWDGKNANFEAPKGSGRNSISAAALWIGGLDAQRKLHVAAQTYRESGSDFWPGPINPATGSSSEALRNAYNKVWKVSKQEIDSFRAGLSTPRSITEWPGNGIAGIGAPAQLAPYVDTDGNGIYEPSKGDYPDIKGDHMLWWVFNDKLYMHSESQGLPLGVEIHASAFVYNCADPALQNAIFLSYKVINRSANKYDSTYIGMWTDLDIGNLFDDYVGSDPKLNMYYGYNGDAYDEDTVISPKGGTFTYKGYGSMLPVQAVSILRGLTGDNGQEMGLSKFIYYNNEESIKGNPRNEVEYYNYLRGRWFNGQSLTFGHDGFGDGPPTDYAFPGDVSKPGDWTETSAHTRPNDRRGIGSFGPLTLEPGAAKEFTIAYTFHQASTGKTKTALEIMKKEVAQIQRQFRSGALLGCTGLDLCLGGSGCVYPGDADNNGKAINTDVFRIGYAFGETGPKRNLASNSWTGQPAANWGKSFPDGLDYKYADTNGDGVINQADVLPINFNYGRTHQKKEDGLRATQVDPVIKVSIDQDSVESGRVMTGTVSVGDAANPAMDVSGLAFTLQFDPRYFDLKSFSIDTDDDELGDTSDFVILVEEDTADGKVDIGIIQKDKSSKTLDDIVITWRIVPDVVVSGIYKVPVSDAIVVNPTLQPKPLTPVGDSASISTSSIRRNNDLSAQVKLYPNPATSQVYVDLATAGNAQLRILSMQGQLIQSVNHTGGQTVKLDIAGLAKGMYLVEIITPQGQAVKKFSKTE